MINETYATDIEADDYLEYTLGTESWFELTDAQKESLLITATRQLERLRHRYSSAMTTQALKFPVNTDDTIDNGLDQAKEATILQALYLHQHADELSQAEQGRIQGIKTQTLGKMGQTATGHNPMAMFSPAAIQILNPYIDLTIRAVR